MSPDKDTKSENGKQPDAFVVYENAKEALDAGVDPEIVFAQWKRQNTTAALVLLPKLNDLMEIWQAYNVPVSVILFFLKSMARTIESVTREHLPPEAIPDYERMLEEVDALISVHIADVGSRPDPLGINLKKKPSKEQTFDPMCR